MQTTTQSEDVAAVVAQAPATVTVPGAAGKTLVLQVPKTDAEVFALVDQRTELSNQLSSVTERRQALAQEIAVTPVGPSRVGLEERLKVLDTRIVQLESDLAATGRQLAAAPGDMVAIAERRGNSSSSSGGDWDEGMAAGIFSTVFFFAIVYAVRRFRGRKKRKSPTPATALTSDSTDRLERLERGMEAIAIEIERVSEGQRFVTKLLSESATPMGVSHRIAQPEQPVRSNPAPTV